MIGRTLANTRTDIGQVAGPQAFSFVVVLPGLLLLSLGTAFADTQNLHHYNEDWIIVAAQAFVVALGTFATAGAPARFVTGAWRPWAVFGVYILTELMRTFVVETQALSRGLVTSVDWTTQLLTAGLTGGTIYAVASLAINQAYNFRTTVAELRTRTALLQTTLARSEIDANVARREIVKSAKDAIRSALKKSLGSTGAVIPSASTIRALLDVSDDVVRPLSHKLMYRQGTFSGIQPEQVRTRLHFWHVIDLASTTRPFRAGATIVVGGMLALGAAVTRAPYGLGVVGLVVLLTYSFGVITLADRVLTGTVRKLPFALRFVILEVVYVLICAPVALAVGVVNVLPPETLIVFVAYATVMGSLILWYLATMAGVRQGYADVIADVESVNRRLEWAVARVNARLWTDQKELSRILHNEVQGVLVATAFKMQRDLEAGIDVTLDIAAVRTSVLEALNNPVAGSTPRLEDALADESERWAGVLNISLDVDDQTLAIVNDDRDARRVIMDLVHEFMVNAVKHGKARNAKMWMRPSSRGTMDISLYNDGLPMPRDRKPGLGIKLAYSVSVSLRLPPQKQGIELRIEIPCEGTDAYVGDRSAPVLRSTGLEKGDVE